MSEIELLCQKEKCYGCFACCASCRNDAISIVQDELGFYYPQIEKSKCIQCGICSRVCPSLNPPKLVKYNQQYYAYKNSDSERMKSSSGALFVALAKRIIEEGGHVYGAVFDGNYRVVHVCTDNINGVDRMRQSKYVQSDVRGIYQNVKQDIQDGIKVLFSGTPCQIAGLENFLGSKSDLLLTVDLICIGVGSPSVFSDFLRYISQYKHLPIDSFRFRAKGKPSGVVITSGKRVIGDKLWLRSFNYLNAHGYIKRDSCFSCPFHSFSRGSDITIGDFWGCKKYRKSFYDDKGISVMLVNSSHGTEIIQQFFDLKDKDSIIQINQFETIQNSLVDKKCDMSCKREFVEYYNNNGYAKSITKYGDYNLKGYIKNIIRKLLVK